VTSPESKILVRLALALPVAVSNFVFKASGASKLGAALLMLGFFGMVYGVGRRKNWTRRGIGLAGVSVALFVFVFYAIVMTPDTAMATSWPDGSYELEKVFFVYEDHIGRPVLVSEYEDYDSDGSFFTDSVDGDPFWQAVYKPFGQVFEDFDSIGIEVGDSTENGIVWSMPFRFPGQYADKEWEDDLYYNWNRYYIPHIGRYNRADPLGNVEDYLYTYALNNPIQKIDAGGLEEGNTEADLYSLFISYWIKGSRYCILYVKYSLHKSRGFSRIRYAFKDTGKIVEDPKCPTDCIDECKNQRAQWRASISYDNEENGNFTIDLSSWTKSGKPATSNEWWRVPDKQRYVHLILPHE